MPITSDSIRAGLDVYTLDGDKLGCVKEVRGSYFQVDAKMQPDYWLDASCVQPTTASDRIVMTFDKDHVGDNKCKLNDNGTLG